MVNAILKKLKIIIMKKTITLHFVTFILVSSIFMSCSKDGSLVNKQELSNTTAAAQQEGVNRIPIIITGGIAGTLYPAPAYAEIIAFKEDGFVKKVLGQSVADEKGQFKIVDLPEGKCIMLVNYTMDNGQNREFSSITRVVEIIMGEVIDLGTIFLLQTEGNK
mgnify:CR=1 FL=1